MTEKTEALRLADRLTLADYYEFDAALHCPPAAAELRRLSKVEAQRDALLEACQTLVNLPEDWIATLRLLRVAVEQARAAIKAVEGENHAKNL